VDRNADQGSAIHRGIMPIPELNESGFLPLGVFECTLKEIEAMFGICADSVQRMLLIEDLKSLIQRLIDTKMIAAILVDGSFLRATGKNLFFETEK
jgi:hypothetical protein